MFLDVNCVDAAVIGLQWGDEGKGKIVDYLAGSFDSVIRFNGGNNAGHTVIVGEKKHKLRILPSGILRDDVTSVIGNGVVLDPYSLLDEIRLLGENGVSITPEKLLIVDSCHLILPLHKELDELFERTQKIGTTKCGVGPCYQDKVARRGIRLCDLRSEKYLKDAIGKLLCYHNIIRRGASLAEVQVDEVLDSLMAIRDEVIHYAISPCELQVRLSGKRKLFEGAQGMLLDIDHGTYPFVTSSSSGVGQVANGAALGPVKSVIGIMKSYATRVGEGAFPTEQNNSIGTELQKRGREIGTVSGRIRRCGWCDLVLVRYACITAGVTALVVTKLDVLDSFNEISLCYGYKTKEGKVLDVCSPSLLSSTECEPQYLRLKGWNSSTVDVTSFEKLPSEAREFVGKIEELLGLPVLMVSTGPGREQVLWKKI
ncbi:adenylosuccinate synthase [Neorickettsia helminthoeca]|uniref:adenylosuccinate synthase n=1 Tax=Neorickettsia helminthoeca TaxID=33994 RepID=UPI001E5F6574|nr:adenylosuccinate synthase [Neorickettsia helminthoeca]